MHKIGTVTESIEAVKMAKQAEWLSCLATTHANFPSLFQSVSFSSLSFYITSSSVRWILEWPMTSLLDVWHAYWKISNCGSQIW